MPDKQAPDWAQYPNLDGVITKADIDTKGGGKFTASYVNHMKIAQLMRQHAPGWQFELRTTTDDQARETHVYRAPNGTGYVVGFFRAPTGSGFLDTPDMVHAVMDHKNNPVAYDRITARDLTDTERRAMCIVAARHFGLAYELWAKDPIEDPYRQEEPASAKAKSSGHTPAQASAPAKAEEPSISNQVATILRPLFKQASEKDMQIITDWRNEFAQAFDGEVKVTKDKLNGDHIKTQAQFNWSEKYINDKLTRSK